MEEPNTLFFVFATCEFKVTTMPICYFQEHRL